MGSQVDREVGREQTPFSQEHDEQFGDVLKIPRQAWDQFATPEQREETTIIPVSSVDAVIRAARGGATLTPVEVKTLCGFLKIPEGTERTRPWLVVSSQALLGLGIEKFAAKAPRLVSDTEIQTGVRVQRFEDETAVISIKGRQLRFTKKQVDLWGLVAQGRSDQEIAEELGRSLQTVKNTLHLIHFKKFKELGFTNVNRHTLAIWYYFLGLGRIEEFSPER